jgi:hypothetical protein
MDLAGEIRESPSRGQPVNLFFLQRGLSRNLAIVRAPIGGNLNGSVISAVNHPAGTMVVGRVAVTLLVHVAHQYKTSLLVPMQFRRREALSD